tara:strand:+ start:16316 stop:16540 length:225 start_codon:yes stop_codon:yes gene_type:complete
LSLLPQELSLLPLLVALDCRLALVEVLYVQSDLSSEEADCLEVERDNRQPPKPLQFLLEEQENHQDRQQRVGVE